MFQQLWSVSFIFFKCSTKNFNTQCKICSNYQTSELNKQIPKMAPK